MADSTSTTHSAPMITAADTERYRDHVREAAQFLQSKTDLTPTLGIVLGTGLGALLADLDVDAEISYEEVPHFPTSTVESHDGKLIAGTLNDTPVFVMQGRMHLYEGYTPRQVTFPIRTLADAGVDTLVISNAAGGVNPQFDRSDIMLITDHINFQGVNPLTGPNVDAWGPRFPDMSEPYDLDLRALAEDVALENGVKLQQGVYLSILGPNLETRAEYRMIRTMGADVVGMSTVPEVLVARHMDVRVLGLSVVTDMALPDALEPVTVEDVIAAADAASPKLTRLVEGVVDRL